MPTEEGPVFSRVPYAVLGVAGIVVATVFAVVATLSATPVTQSLPGPVLPAPVNTASRSATPRPATPAPMTTSTAVVVPSSAKATTTTPRPSKPAAAGPTTTTQAPPPPPPPPPPPQPPVPSFRPACPNTGLSCTFDASASHDPDGRIIYYAWAFGDGSGAEGPGRSRVEHTYREPGTYRVTLAIMDNSGTIRQTSREVRVGG